MGSPGVPAARVTWAVALFGLAPLLLIAVDSSLEQRLGCLMVYLALAWAGYFFMPTRAASPSRPACAAGRR